MKFIVLTNPDVGNNFVNELIVSGLIPEMIVTDSPFYVKKTFFLKYIAKKILQLLRYLKNRDVINRKYQPYFLAKKYNIPIYSSKNVNSKRFEEIIRDKQIDYIFTFIFKILTENIFNAPKFGCINFHPSLLPYNRGATPWSWIVLDNQQKTGITFHYITKAIDKGSIIEQYEIPISEYANIKILKQYLFSLGSVFFVQLIFKIKYNKEQLLIKDQIEEGSYEPPFGEENRVISENNTFNEIGDIIRASRDDHNNAVYQYDGKKKMVINCIEIIENDLTNSKFPYTDKHGNIYVRSSDKKIILLITNKLT
jgi:methionyl-tRNA formyltransferase